MKIANNENIFVDIKFKIDMFSHFGLIPKCVYLGEKTYKDMIKQFKKIKKLNVLHYNCVLPLKETVFGLPIIKVNEKEYLDIGVKDKL